jgi:hypothetical protein
MRPGGCSSLGFGLRSGKVGIVAPIVSAVLSRLSPPPGWRRFWDPRCMRWARHVAISAVLASLFAAFAAVVARVVFAEPAAASQLLGVAMIVAGVAVLTGRQALGCRRRLVLRCRLR